MSSMSQPDWPALIRGFPAARVMVVGDVMLDRYWYGAVSRVSPEAPVVVVSKTHGSLAPGGAGNTAANVSSLGGRASLVSVCGMDAAAGEMRSALQDRGVTDLCLVEDPGRPTTVKTRVLAFSPTMCVMLSLRLEVAVALLPWLSFSLKNRTFR